MPDLTCPCDGAREYAHCCQPIHRGELEAATPEALMRSRYSAFALGLIDYLRHSWAPETCPVDLELDPAQRWTRLRILDAPAVEGERGVVHFRAHYRYGEERDFLEERSRFRREAGRWVYVDGEIL